MASRSTGRAGRPSCSRRPATSRPIRSPGPTASSASCAPTRPRRSRGWGSSTPWSSVAAWRSTWASARRRRCSPTSPAPPATAPPSSSPHPPWSATGRPRPRKFTPGIKVLVHHGASRASGRRHGPCLRRRRRRHHHVRHRGARHGRAVGAPLAPRSSSTRRRPSRTTPRSRRSSCADSTPAPVSRSTGTPIENGLGDLWAILDFANPGLVGNRAGFISQMQGEGEAALRALNGILVFRRTKSEPEVAARAARPHRRARPLHDDARAGRPLPGGARQPGGRRQRGRRRRTEAGGDPGRHHRAQADLQPPGRLPDRRPSAGGTLGQAHPPRGDRRHGVRRRREGARSSPTSPSGGSRWPTTSPS